MEEKMGKTIVHITLLAQLLFAKKWSELHHSKIGENRINQGFDMNKISHQLLLCHLIQHVLLRLSTSIKNHSQKGFCSNLVSWFVSF